MSLPLTLPPYYLDATATVQVTLTTSYSTAVVSFYNAGMIYYTVTLVQQAPVVTLPSNLAIGSFVIKSGKLTLQVPGSMQQGTVTLNCQYTDPAFASPQGLNAVIASWTLDQ